MTNKYDYLYINKDNKIMGRFDGETYTHDSQGRMVGFGVSLEDAKCVASNVAIERGIDFSDIVISLNHKEFRGKK